MIDFRNPYTPGAGVMPKYLAGRDELLQSANRSLQAISQGYAARSVVYYGLRGVGKTVILNALESYADDLGMLVRHIEVKEDPGSFVRALSTACNAFVLNLSARETFKNAAAKLLSVVKSFTATWNPSDSTLSLELSADAFSSATAGSGDLSNDLTEVMVALGGYAAKAESAICFCVDEIQYARPDELEALIAALHRVNQLGLPIIFFCAGLPKILKEMGDAKSYTERLFEFIEVDSLDREGASKAIVEPAASLGVTFDLAAIDAVLDATGCYPYFIQELCSTIWELCSGNQVSIDMVRSCIDSANVRLDEGFFRVRYSRCTQREQEFLIAMVKCGELPCTLANVAANMDRPTKSIAPFRAKLISKGIIFAVGRGEVDFTVPKFDEFLKRELPGVFI